MGIFNAMQTAVSGMQVQGYSLDNISANIANSQTIGYKRIETNFRDLIPNMNSTMQQVGGVGATSTSTNQIGGAFRATGNPTDLAIAGNGYFVVSSKSSDASSVSSFGPANLYTRRGDFRLDKNNNLVNGAGYYLTGYSIDPTSGVVNSGTPTTIQIPTTDLAPKATSKVTYSGNLPKTPGYQAAGTALAAPQAAGTHVTAANEQTFLSQSIAGGAVTVYDSAGNASTVQLRWAKTSEADDTATPPVTAKWDLYYLSDSKATGTDPKWTSLGNLSSFNEAGALQSGTTATMSVTVDGKALGPMTIDFKGLSQYGDTNGTFRQTNLAQDGHSAATVTGVEIGDQGRVYAKYSNGMQIAVADIAVAHFNGENNLKRLDGGIYEQTEQSGEPIYGLNGANIVAGGVEASNADISQEFTLMISTQQAYTANAKVISAAQQMMSDAVNIIR
jgi:flagellar hook protein FlgE